MKTTKIRDTQFNFIAIFTDKTGKRKKKNKCKRRAKIKIKHKYSLLRWFYIEFFVMTELVT